MKPKRNAQHITTVRQLAEHTNRSAGQVGRWLKDDRWPFARVAPWPMSELPAIREWAAGLRETTGGNIPGRAGMNEAKRELAEAQLALLELENSIARGDYCNCDEFQSLVTQALVDARTTLMAMPGRYFSGYGQIDAASLTASIESVQTEVLERVQRAPQEATAEAEPIDTAEIAAFLAKHRLRSNGNNGGGVEAAGGEISTPGDGAAERAD
jgi:hypothetical protein